MPFRVNKTYLVDTEDVDEAYNLTKIDNQKVATLAVGQIMPYDPAAAANNKTAQVGAALPPATR